MKRIFNLIFLLFVVAACTKPQPELPVNKMEIDPASIQFFPGDVQEVNVLCYPEHATNLDQLVVFVSNTNVADFQNGKLTAKAPGAATLQARCGDVSAQARITVYSGYFTKADKKYGVDSATGYLFTMGESTPQEMQMTLTHTVNSEDTQSFWLHIKYSNLGKDIDFMRDMDETMVSVQLNNNEDGYCIPYAQEDGTPVVKLADWGDTDATLTRGVLRVDDLGGSKYKVTADFALSNGYTFTANWEGTASMQKE